ncbi:MAG: 4-alpha-glucanotransferase, partial [Erysipelotrichaceae bacterium]|nr:4-alpha-glucanotransferase [Erysipelotrichaceae bacterium]
MRKAGLLIPVSSLPSRFGIGDFGPTSYELVDLIEECGFKIWQILPLNPLGFGNSPYQSYSSKAMDEIYISLEILVEEGLLDEVKEYRARAGKVDYAKVRAFKEPYLRKAFRRFVENEEYKEFTAQKWVREYAVFAALKKANNRKCWNEWPLLDKQWISNQKELPELEEEIRYGMFL